MSRIKWEAVAIMTLAADRRRLGKSVIVTNNSEQAMAIASALQGITDVEAIPCKRDFDVFGRVFWSNRVID